MPRHLIVLGGGVGGLCAAIYARLSGWEVTLLEQRGVLGGKAAQIKEGGFTLDPGPSIIILPRIYDSVFEDAGRNPRDYIEFNRLDPITRLFPEGRDPIDIPSSIELCRDLIRSLAPEDAAGFDELLVKGEKLALNVEKTVFDGPIESPAKLLNPKFLQMGMLFGPNHSYKQIVDRLFKSELLKSFFYGFPTYSGNTYRAKAVGALLIPYYLLSDGVYYPNGGVGAIPRALERLARELGVDVKTGVRVSGLSTDGKKVTSVHVVPGAQLTCDAVISNIDRFTVDSKYLARQIKDPPSFSYFTMAWHTEQEGSPFAHHNLIIPDDYREAYRSLFDRFEPAAKPIVYVNTPSATDPSVAPKGLALNFAVATVPAITRQVPWHQLEETYPINMIKSLRSGVAGSEITNDNLLDIQSPVVFEQRDGSYKGSLYGLTEKKRLYGVLPASNRDPVLKNLFFCGGSVQPGAGLPMVVLSGKFAARMLPTR